MTAPGGTNLRTGVLSLLSRVSWLADSNGAGAQVLYLPLAVLDGINEMLRVGVLAHVPGTDPNGDPYATTDALAFVGADSQIDRGPADTDAQYANRTADRFNTWSLAGSAWSILRDILNFVRPAAPIVRIVGDPSVWDSINDPAAPNAGTPTWRLNAQPLNWNWDGRYLEHRFVVILYGPFGNGRKWGDGWKWGDGTKWGVDDPTGQIASVRSIIRKWMRLGSWCEWIIISFDSSLFSPTAPPGDASLPDGTWGERFKIVNMNYTSSRSASARYAPGTT